MGKVSALIEIKPDGPEVDMDELRDDVEDNLPEGGKVTDTDTEEIAFGLKKLLVQVTIPDSEGGTEEVEASFEEIDGVQSVDTDSVTRL